MRLLAACLLLLAVAPAAADAAPVCGKRDGRTIAKTERTRVYVSQDEAWGCYAGQRPFDLGNWDPVDDESSINYATVRHVRLSGRYVGFASECYCGSSAYVDFLIHVVDLKARRTIRLVSTGRRAPGAPRNGVRGIGPATDLVLKSNGAVAWIAGDHSTEPDTLQVHRCDARGCARLSVGSAIAPRSLFLTRGRIGWSDAGRTESSDLR